MYFPALHKIMKKGRNRGHLLVLGESGPSGERYEPLWTPMRTSSAKRPQKGYVGRRWRRSLCFGGSQRRADLRSVVRDYFRRQK